MAQWHSVWHVFRHALLARMLRNVRLAWVVLDSLLLEQVSIARARHNTTMPCQVCKSANSVLCNVYCALIRVTALHAPRLRQPGVEVVVPALVVIYV